MRRMICGAIRAYQIGISPWVPAACRFTPTCSRYALESVGRFGVLQGGQYVSFGKRLTVLQSRVGCPGPCNTPPLVAVARTVPLGRDRVAVHGGRENCQPALGNCGLNLKREHDGISFSVACRRGAGPSPYGRCFDQCPVT